MPQINIPTLKDAHTAHVQNLEGLAFAFWLSGFIKVQADTLHVVIADTQERLYQLEHELRFFGVVAHSFADYETLVYDQLAVHQDIISERIHLLTNMPKSGVLLVSVQTLMQRICPPQFLLGHHFDLRVGDSFDIDSERERLIKAGYRHVDNVFEAGEFAIRGSVVDIFAMGQALPFRLDLFDDEIEYIKFFDPQNQRTLSDEALDKLKKDSLAHNNDFEYSRLPDKPKTDEFMVLPAREFALVDGRENFRQNFAKIFGDVSARKVELYIDVLAGIAPAGIEYYAPLFFDLDEWQASGTLFDYLPKNTSMIMMGDVAHHHTQVWDQLQARYHNYGHDKQTPILAPKWLFLPFNEFFARLKPFAKVQFDKKACANDAFIGWQNSLVPSVSINHKQSEPLADLLQFLQHANQKTLIVAESAGRREILLELLKDKVRVTVVADFNEFLGDLSNFNENHIALTVAPIEQGLMLHNNATTICVLSEAQIFGRQITTTQRRTRTMSQALIVKSVSEMSKGSLVVHIEHGIGRYQGLTMLDLGDGEQEFIHLKYADDASIYVPITQLALIGRYSGTDSEAVQLSKIGSGKWDKAKQKTLEQIYDVAAELLNVQARRNAKSGISFDIDMQSYELFASSFEYEETIDQMVAIDNILHDMKQNKPMDRLICGDVGFGKTEVAMRAAFVAVQAGYQVAVLVPTTLLAGQHEDSFKTRFADWAVRIESLSRFVSKKSQDAVLADLAAGKVDIVIGTHKLLQDDVKFKNLGLMIIDEEHRFGVRHKDKIKAMQSDVDSLSMTATPIPRTLNMALSGMQDISIIATPPARRLAIKTFVTPKSDIAIKEAMLREILRGGQVYFLHNDVASIETMAETLKELVPQARVGVAHGQMPERELSAVMSDFYHKRFNVLIASTIIETGIDVPNANTIIINRADKFGLAQLHQLRGRVGRSHHQAYCYLLVPSLKGLTADAKKRLEAISRANTLGAGFVLASEDLEIRGAGEILGKEQSGNMQTIGFGLYMDMLERATKAIKQGKTPNLATPLELVSDINVHASALIPDDYLGDVSERLLFYKRISNLDEIDELNDIKTEMIDRFGALPIPTKTLFAVHALRIKAHALGIGKIDANAKAITLEFNQDTPVDGLAIVKLIQSVDKDGSYRMNGAMGVRFSTKVEMSLEQRMAKVGEMLHYFYQSIHDDKRQSV
ncbi:transcription-repair coupling factor [Moraxella nasovis]|uniref:transcription-repair coupling factor n=1 Tax=Moraxella nasovis TaxID=2904121 RepID=UPI001F62484E|nr:transcription-repair coupling factor [Moraxella nasovis]UNU73299.1 transcription-repair coupling factor [Moraxella nasovis]